MLVQCKAGVEHLYEKLSHIKTSKGHVPQAQISSTSDEYVLDLLSKCEEKLLKLMEELQDTDVGSTLEKMQQEEVRRWPVAVRTLYHLCRLFLIVVPHHHREQASAVQHSREAAADPEGRQL